MTQKDLAKRIGVDPRSVQGWEANRILPARDNLTALAKALNTTPEYILHGEAPRAVAENLPDYDAIELPDREKLIVAEALEKIAGHLRAEIARHTDK